MVAIVLWNLAVWIVVAGLRFGVDMDLALPFARRSWPFAAAVSGALFVLAFRREVVEGRRPCSSRDHAALWIILGIGPLLLWIFGDRVVTRGFDAIVLVALALVGLERVVAHRKLVFRRDVWFATGGRVGGALAAGTAVVAVVAFVAGRFAGSGEADPTHWAVALATYPLYAMVQLGATLALPARVWRSKDEHGPRATIAGLAFVFAWIHAPNPLVMVLTGGGMVAWALAHQRRVGFAWIALSMGLAGATVAQSLPDSWTQNMRVGAAYVLALQTERHIDAYDDQVEAWSTDAYWKESGSSTEGWLRAISQDIFGASIANAVLEDWTFRLQHARRRQIVLAFLDTERFRRRHGIERRMDGRDRSLLHSTFAPWHPAQGAVLETLEEDPSNPPVEDFEAFLARIYREVLDRDGSDEEIASWSQEPRPGDRPEIVRHVLGLVGVEDPAEWRRPADPLAWARP